MGGVEKREKERLKMGGKEEKRGACRGESLIICLPIPTTTSHFRSTTKPLIKECGKEERSDVEQMRRMDEMVCG